MKIQAIRLNLYEVIRAQVENGVVYALTRATKHVPWSTYAPEHKRRELEDDVTEAVMTKLCERIEFSDPAGIQTEEELGRLQDLVEYLHRRLDTLESANRAAGSTGADSTG